MVPCGPSSSGRRSTVRPTSPFTATTSTLAFLVRQQVEIVTAPRAGVEYIVVGRELERSGRKGLAATALLDADGEVLAHGEALFVEPRAEGAMSHKGAPSSSPS